MTRDDLERLGNLVYKQDLVPVVKPRMAKKVAILGFDTEYDSETRELLSIQLSFQGKDLFLPVNPGIVLTWEMLEAVVMRFLTNCGLPIGWRALRRVILVSYFSVAESQHITNLTDAEVFETSVGTDFQWKGKGGRILELVDLMKFFAPGAPPLARAAEGFGLRKLDWDTTRVTRADLTRDGFREYAVNDAHLTEKIFVALRERYVERFRVDIVMTKTPAQTSATAYRLNYLSRDCNCPPLRTRRQAMLSAWGGRNEAYRIGTFRGTFYEYDAFSEYPSSAVALGRMPMHDDWRSSTCNDDLIAFPGIAHVRFRFPKDCQFPCLPVFHENKLFYPLTGRSHCTNAEIKFAIELGAEIDLIEGYHYRRGDDSLSRYMKEMLKERQEASARDDKIGKHVMKLAVNSLIGKFLQRVDTIDLNALIELERRSGMPVHVIRKMDKAAILQVADSYGVEAELLYRILLGSAFCPEWNALILGYARVSTSRFLVKVAKAGHRPMIMSTDSVIFETPPETPEPEKEYFIGGIRFERREMADTMQVLRTRLYRMSDSKKPDVWNVDKYGNRTTKQNTIKIAHHAIAGRTFAEDLFDELLNNPAKEYRYRKKRIIKFREALTFNRDYGGSEIVPRTVRLGYDRKRRLSGRETTPWDTAAQAYEAT